MIWREFNQGLPAKSWFCQPLDHQHIKKFTYLSLNRKHFLVFDLIVYRFFAVHWRRESNPGWVVGKRFPLNRNPNWIVNVLLLISGTISELKRVKTKFGGLPNDGDLQGAAKALNRLQEMYKFNVTQFSRGNILGIQTGAELEAKDTFYLGR